MTEIKTYCDKCGVELVGIHNYEDTDIEIAHYYRRVDLCPVCFEKLTNIIEDFFYGEDNDGTEKADCSQSRRNS